MICCQSWALYLVVAWAVGGTLAHHLFLAVHEITHGLALPWGDLSNNLLAIGVNVAMPIPYAMAFRKYHALHHSHITVDGKDLDLPTRAEALLLNSRPGRLLFCIFQGVFYTLRPVVVAPSPPTALELLNFAVVMTTNVLLARFLGLGTVLYLLYAIGLGTGLHPMAAHFLTEHYIMTGIAET